MAALDPGKTTVQKQSESSDGTSPFPADVRAEVESHIEIAKAFAVTMALFAAVQISFAQMIAATPKHETNNKNEWDALYIFTYGSIIFNLGGSAGAITVLYQITALENRLQGRGTRTRKRSSLRRGMSADWNLLRQYGMSNHYKCIWLHLMFRPAVYGTLIPFAAFALLFSLSFMFLSNK